MGGMPVTPVISVSSRNGTVVVSRGVVVVAIVVVARGGYCDGCDHRGGEIGGRETWRG